MVHITIVEVHQVRPLDGDPGTFRSIQLNRRVGDVFWFDFCGGLDLHEVESLLGVSRNNIDPCSDALEGEGSLVQGRNGSIGQKGLGCPDSLIVLQVGFFDELAVGEPLPCHFTDGGAGVEPRLCARIHRIGQLPVVAFQVESFQALKPILEFGFGWIRRQFLVGGPKETELRALESAISPYSSQPGVQSPLYHTIKAAIARLSVHCIPQHPGDKLGPTKLAHLWTDLYNYGLIGDMSSAALVGTDGSVDWCCFPRFDSPSVFAGILDPETGGCFRISPADPGFDVRQAYLTDTNILETTFTTATGVVSVTDFMPASEDDDNNPDTPSNALHEIHRIVRCLTGEVDMCCDFQPRHDYARSVPSFSPLRSRSGGGAVQASGGRQTMTLSASIPLPFDDRGATCPFTLAEGQSAVFVLAYGHSRPASFERFRTAEKLDYTRRYWQGLVAHMNYDGLWRDAVVRSFLALHLMMYRNTGAIVAAPTTSLPESIGGSRNWDYRFSWLRDASFTVDVLYRLGDVYGADRYMNWLLEQCQLGRRKTRIIYGISPNSSLREYTLSHLRGYEGSRPVRIGNAAAKHLQLDVFGEVIISIHSLLLLFGDISTEAWELVHAMAEVVMANWHRKDRGVWEVRGEQQHFVYSKLMCWAGLDRAAYIADAKGHVQLCRHWSLTADKIKSEILDSGWSSNKRAFRQRYGDDALDASNLVMPFVGLIPRDDPRILQNVNAIERELTDGPLVWRYIPEETDDGLGGQPEGAFTLLSFWLIGNFIYTGQMDRGFDYFHEVITKQGNHLGLFAEMFDPVSKRQLGNFPQAYSHIGLIHTALNLSGFIADTPTRRSNPSQ